MTTLLVALLLGGFLFPPLWIAFAVALIIAACKPRKVVVIERDDHQRLEPRELFRQTPLFDSRTGLPLARGPGVPFGLFIFGLLGMILGLGALLSAH